MVSYEIDAFFLPLLECPDDSLLMSAWADWLEDQVIGFGERTPDQRRRLAWLRGGCRSAPAAIRAAAALRRSPNPYHYLSGYRQLQRAVRRHVRSVLGMQGIRMLTVVVPRSGLLTLPGQILLHLHLPSDTRLDYAHLVSIEGSPVARAIALPVGSPERSLFIVESLFLLLMGDRPEAGIVWARTPLPRSPMTMVDPVARSRFRILLGLAEPE